MTARIDVPFFDAFADLSGGNTKTPQSAYLPEGQLPIVDQGRELIGGYTDDLSRTVRSELPVIVFGDHTRAIKFVDFPFGMGADGVKVLRPIDGWDSKFLYHYLNSVHIPSAGYSRHFKFLKELRVPKPPIPEQERVVRLLDHADALRAKRRQAIAHLDDLTQSIFLDMFGEPTADQRRWPVRPLHQVSTIAGQYGAGVPSVEFDPRLPRYVRITDVTEQGFLTQPPRSPGGSPGDWSAHFLEPGDLLFARSGATVGKTYVHRAEYGRCVFAGYLIRFRLDTSVLLPEYAFRFTQTTAYLSWVAEHQRAVAQPNINAKQYGAELMIPIPPIELQQEFMLRSASIYDTRSTLTQHLQELDALFAALQSRAFRGEL